MKKRNIWLIVQSALCILIAAMLSCSAIRIYLDGSAYQAAGHPTEWIYTREKAVSALIPVLPVFIISLGVNLFCVVKEFKDEEADKPVHDIEFKRNSESKLSVVRWVLMAAAIVFVIMGIQNGSMEDVLVKAIKICTECVGLG